MNQLILVRLLTSSQKHWTRQCWSSSQHCNCWKSSLICQRLHRSQEKEQCFLRQPKTLQCGQVLPTEGGYGGLPSTQCLQWTQHSHASIAVPPVVKHCTNTYNITPNEKSLRHNNSDRTKLRKFTPPESGMIDLKAVLSPGTRASPGKVQIIIFNKIVSW